MFFIVIFSDICNNDYRIGSKSINFTTHYHTTVDNLITSSVSFTTVVDLITHRIFYLILSSFFYTTVVDLIISSFY
jgi:hypothetical protein